MSFDRRKLLAASLGGTALLSTGCMTKPLRPANPDGTYCFRIGRVYRQKLTCTPGPIPAEQVEAAAKRFEVDPGKLTIYLVRKRWGDAQNVVRVAIEGGASIETVPESFARWKLPGGRHVLTAVWPEGKASLEVSGQAGDIIFVEVIGSVWVWGSIYRLEIGEPADSRQRLMPLRLIADLA